jgi:protein phosphatase PTC2/3
MLYAYGANTNNGIIRTYNEDRISIVLDLKKPTGVLPKDVTNEGKIQFFAIFDGHGGQGCSEFLRDNLHNFIASSPSFPMNLE